MKITGELFGTIVFEGFLTKVPLSWALRYFYDSAKKQVAKMFRFSMIAIEQFKSICHEYP